MIEAYQIAGGKAMPCELEGINSKAASFAFCINPVGADVARIAKKLGVPFEDIKKSLHEDTGPRICEKESCIIITYRAPHTGSSKTITMPSVVMINKNLAVAVFQSPLKNIDSLRQGMAQGNFPPVFREGVPGIVACVFDKINDEFSDALDGISASAEEFEKKLHVLSREDARKIYSLNMTLSYFQRALVGNREVLKEISGGEVPGLSGEKVGRLFSELQKDVVEISDAEEIQKSTINNMFVLHSNILSNEMNAVMKKLAAIGAIILAPTLVAGIYGMNIAGLPFAEREYGFKLVLGAILGTAGVIALYFRKNGWI